MIFYQCSIMRLLLYSTNFSIHEIIKIEHLKDCPSRQQNLFFIVARKQIRCSRYEYHFQKSTNKKITIIRLQRQNENKIMETRQQPFFLHMIRLYKCPQTKNDIQNLVVKKYSKYIFILRVLDMETKINKKVEHSNLILFLFCKNGMRITRIQTVYIKIVQQQIQQYILGQQNSLVNEDQIDQGYSLTNIVYSKYHKIFCQILFNNLNERKIIKSYKKYIKKQIFQSFSIVFAQKSNRQIVFQKILYKLSENEWQHKVRLLLVKNNLRKKMEINQWYERNQIKEIR